MVFTAFLLDTQQQSDSVKEKPASSLVLSLGKNNTSIIMWQTAVVDEQSTRSNGLVEQKAEHESVCMSDKEKICSYQDI